MALGLGLLADRAGIDVALAAVGAQAGVDMGVQLAFDAQARQYARMRMLFAHGLDLIFDKSTNAPKPGASAKLVHALFVELGMEAMRENAGWVAIYRQHPIRLPQG